MDGVDRRRMRRRRTLKQRLGCTGMGCCGGAAATWGLGPTTMSVRDDDNEEEELQQHQYHQAAEIEVNNPGQALPEPVSDPGCLGPTPTETPTPTPTPTPAAAGMNLAAALAAERQFRATSNEPDGRGVTVGTVGNTAPGTPLRKSLMRLLEESTDGGGDGGVAEEEVDEVGGSDRVCCVCMGRKKGAAFIPCGHTFCRICSRELWLNRGACPLCNRPILEILDIF